MTTGSAWIQKCGVASKRIRFSKQNFTGLEEKSDEFIRFGRAIAEETLNFTRFLLHSRPKFSPCTNECRLAVKLKDVFTSEIVEHFSGKIFYFLRSRKNLPHCFECAFVN